MSERIITVYCDESGNGGRGHLVVAGVVLENIDVRGARTALREEVDRTLALAERSGVPVPRGFEENGFHKSGGDKPGVQSSVIESLARGLRCKVFLVGTDRTTVKSEKEIDHLLELYRKLGLTVSRRYSEYDELHFVIETNEHLKPYMTSLVAEWNSATRLRTVSAEQAAKAPDSPLAYADYFAGPCANWLDRGMTVPETNDGVHLQFAKLLPNVSLILSLEKGRLHSRRHPWRPLV